MLQFLKWKHLRKPHSECEKQGIVDETAWNRNLQSGLDFGFYMNFWALSSHGLNLFVQCRDGTRCFPSSDPSDPTYKISLFTIL